MSSTIACPLFHDTITHGISGSQSGSTSLAEGCSIANAWSGRVWSWLIMTRATAPASTAYRALVLKSQPPRIMNAIWLSSFIAFLSGSQPVDGFAITGEASIPNTNSSSSACVPNCAITASAAWMTALCPHSSSAASSLLRFGNAVAAVSAAAAAHKVESVAAHVARTVTLGSAGGNARHGRMPTPRPPTTTTAPGTLMTDWYWHSVVAAVPVLVVLQLVLVLVLQLVLALVLLTALVLLSRGWLPLPVRVVRVGRG